MPPSTAPHLSIPVHAPAIFAPGIEVPDERFDGGPGAIMERPVPPRAGHQPRSGP